VTLLPDDYIAQANRDAMRYQGQWTGTQGTLAAHTRRLILEREEIMRMLEEKQNETRLSGDGLMAAGDVHPSSQEFYDLLDQIRELHASKSRDYGSEHDPLANIRNGAEFVGIEPWRAAMVRLSDKVTRLATFNRTGSLHYEGVEDTLLDLASYSLLALVLFRQDRGT
jgi:hypothetical protein